MEKPVGVALGQVVGALGLLFLDRGDVVVVMGLRLLGTPVFDDPLDLLVRNEDALQAHRAGQVGRLVEHVAAADEVLRAGRVEDRARVDLRGHGEGDAGREVGLDQPSDYVHRRPLRGHDQMDARRAGQLRQPADLSLHFVRGDHH